MNEVVVCLFGSTGFDRAAQGVLGAGRRLADDLGVSLQAVIVGNTVDTMKEETYGRKNDSKATLAPTRDTEPSELRRELTDHNLGLVIAPWTSLRNSMSPDFWALSFSA